MKKHGSEYPQHVLDNNANIHNPNNRIYQKPQGNYVPTPADKKNRDEQLNRNNLKYWGSRGQK